METKKDITVTSLDDVDLSSLTISQRHSDDGAVATCSTSNLDSRRSEYNKVVKTDDTEQGVNEPVIKNFTCHICEINVPYIYFTEHETSGLHICNKEIAVTALERLELFYANEYINENNEKLSSKYFCAECSIVINRKDKKSHKQSIMHKKSLKIVEILKKFLKYYNKKIYKGVDNITNDIRTEHVEESKSSEQENFSEKFSAEEMPTLNSIINSDEKKSITNAKKEKTESRKEDVKETEGGENTETLSNLDELNSDPSKDLKEDEMLLEINVGSNINKFKVTKCCVESIVETGATFDCCMLCYETFPKANRSTHIKSDLHNQNCIIKPLDQNCIRKLNSRHHNCVLCDDYFEEYGLHVNSEKHLTNFRNKLICKETAKAEDSNSCNEEKEYDNSKETSDVLEVGNKSLTDENENTAPANEKTTYGLALRTSFRWLYSYIFPSVNLSSNILCDTCNDWVSMKRIKKHKLGTKHIFNSMSEYHYLLKNLDGGHVSCKICKVTVSNLQEDIEDHCTRSKHLKNCSKLLNAQSISKVDNKIYYCAKCKQYILHKNEYLHIKSKKHRQDEEIDKIGLIETVITDKGSDGRSNDQAEAGNATHSAALACNICGVGSSNATDNVKAINNYCPVSNLITIFSKFPKINAYKMVEQFGLNNTSMLDIFDTSEAGLEEVRMLKVLLKHSISLRRKM